MYAEPVSAGTAGRGKGPGAESRRGAHRRALVVLGVLGRRGGDAQSRVVGTAQPAAPIRSARVDLLFAIGCTVSIQGGPATTLRAPQSSAVQSSP